MRCFLDYLKSNYKASKKKKAYHWDWWSEYQPYLCWCKHTYFLTNTHSIPKHTTLRHMQPVSSFHQPNTYTAFRYQCNIPHLYPHDKEFHRHHEYSYQTGKSFSPCQDPKDKSPDKTVLLPKRLSQLPDHTSSKRVRHSFALKCVVH